MTVNILPNAKTQFIDGNGVPLEGGFVYMYVPNTTTFKTTWQDSAGTIPNTNPVELDADGYALIWGSGAYRQIVTDSLSNTIWDQVTLDPGYAAVASFGGTSTSAVTIGTGAKTFATQSGLAFFTGGTLLVSSNASALNYMVGTVTSYNTTTGALVMNITDTGGSGLHSDWAISVSGKQGSPGTVTAVSIATANGFSGTSTGGGTPALTIIAGAIVPSSVNSVVISGSSTPTLAVTGTTSVSGANTGDQTITLTSDVTGTGTGSFATTIANSAVTTAKINNGAVTEAKITLADNTTNNVTTSAHGFAPKAPNVATQFLNGVGAYSVPVTNYLVGTSTTSLLIATGTKVYTVAAGLSIAAGQFLLIPSNANAANYMYGQITSYASTTLTMSISATGGSGTFADWNIYVAGPQGPSGGVTSIGLSTNASYLTVASSPVTSTGTITLNKTTGLTQNQVVATPNGSTGVADLRSLVAADLPSTAVTPGSYTLASITVDQQGRLTSASSGTSFNASPITNSLSGDVSLSNTSNYFDGPSVAQGSTGTWFVSGTITVTDTNGAAEIYAKLWDGTTVIASSITRVQNTNNDATLSLSGYLATPAGNLRISARDVSSVGGKILFNTSGNSKDSTISAFRIT